MYQIRDSEAGNVIEEVTTEKEAFELIKRYELEDGESVGFYEVYDTEKQEII